MTVLATGTHASSQFSNLVVHESIPSAPNGFTRLSSAPANQTLHLRIALSNSNITGLEDMLYAVSSPGSPLYGQHLSKEAVSAGCTYIRSCTNSDQVEEYVRPTSETTSIVTEFLRMNNISTKTISPAGDWLAFSIPVIQANALFNANYSVFRHDATGSQITRTLSYSIPAILQGHLELVHPSISFDIPSNRAPVNVTRISSPSQHARSSRLDGRQTDPSSCDDEVTPSCLQSLYGIPTELAAQSTKSV